MTPRTLPTIYDEVIATTPIRHTDDRGWFSQTYSRKEDIAAGIQTTYVQDNHSFSHSAGTIRGFHFQRPPFAQAKLVRCLRGSIMDYVVDIRRDSPTFGTAVSFLVSKKFGNQVYIPEGYAHAFITLEKNTEISYKVSQDYSPEHEGGLKWDDQILSIDWPLSCATPEISAKDRNWPSLSAAGPLPTHAEWRAKHP
jgi:dTDP-4-dehydrorhamnose 3,5-epimerase